MDFHFLFLEKSWKINVEKEGAPWVCVGCFLHSVLGHCWLGDRKGIRPVESWVLVVTI